MGLLSFYRAKSTVSSDAPAAPASIQPEPPRILDDAPPQPTPLAVQVEPSNTVEASKTSLISRIPTQHRSAVLFAAGVAFSACSVLITRRSLARRRITGRFTSLAPGHQQSQVVPAVEAFEALNIATINVVSFAMLAAGGTLWSLNINTLDDARRFVRGGMGLHEEGTSDPEADKELEEMLINLLAKKETKEKGDMGRSILEEIEKLKK